jgi:hypothetical protein
MSTSKIEDMAETPSDGRRLKPEEKSSDDDDDDNEEDGDHLRLIPPVSYPRFLYYNFHLPL